MDLELDEDQLELRKSVAEFLGAECPVSVVRRVVETGEPAEDLWASMVKLDWPALNIPETAGGMGLGPIEVSVVIEEIGSTIAPGPYLSTATQFVPAILAADDAAARQRYLAPVAAGERTGTLVSGVGAVSSGSGWKLSGESLAIGVRTDTDVAVLGHLGDGGYGTFVVPAEAVTSVTAVRSLDASRPLSRLLFSTVEVGPEGVLGEPGSKASAAARTRALDEAALFLGIEAVGTCRSLLEMTLGHVKDRHQFGVPIGSFQAIKHKMADVHVAIERARAVCTFATAALAEDDPRVSLAASMAKAAADDTVEICARESIQTFGGIGFTWEADVHLFVKRALSSAALFGSASDHRLAVARHLGVFS